MQFQIECNTLTNYQACFICHKQFQLKEARLIICNDQGDGYGDICPQCMAMGAFWIGNQLKALENRLMK
ncbi:hypothetical protein ABN584_06535 [Gloeocapsa sp. BRSZ]